MSKSSKKSIPAIEPVEFSWHDDMSSTGFTAKEVDSVLVDLNNSADTITITGSPDYTIAGAQGVGTITFDSSAINWSTNYSIGTDGTEYGKSEIKLSNGKRIDLDELADVIETMKKRLLILAPNFEMHEKYPMLKELYEEYKAMEKLLSGPDLDQGDM